MPYTKRYTIRKRKPYTKRYIKKKRQTRRRATELLTGTFANSPLAQSVAGQVVKYGYKAAKAGVRKFTNRPRRAVYIDGGVKGGQSDMLSAIVVNAKVANTKRIPRMILKTGYLKRTLRWQAVKTMNLTQSTAIPGAIDMQHGSFGSTLTATPFYMFCLNKTINDTNAADILAGPMVHIRFNDTGGVDLRSLQNQNPDGTLGTVNWLRDYTSEITVGDPDCRYIMNAYYDIRMNLYGCNRQPTVYDIMVISFNDDYLDPHESPSNGQEAADRHKTYQGMIQSFMTNPILPSAFVKNKFRVHTRTRVTLQPTLSIENDVNPQSRVVKMLVKDGSWYDYAYHGDGFTGAGADDKLSTVQYVAQNTSNAGDYSNMPQPKARKYLVIRAMNTTRIDTTVEQTSNNTPSFDIVVRKTEYYASG